MYYVLLMKSYDESMSWNVSRGKELVLAKSLQDSPPGATYGDILEVVVQQARFSGPTFSFKRSKFTVSILDPISSVAVFLVYLSTWNGPS